MSDIKIDMFAMDCPVSIGEMASGGTAIVVGTTETPWGTSVVVGVNARDACNTAALSPDMARQIAQRMLSHADEIDGGATASNGTLQ